MAAPSYLRPDAVEKIRLAQRRGFATRAAVRGTVPLVLARWNPATEKHDALPPQEVIVTYANRTERRAGGEAAAADLVDGWFEKAAPLDAERDDLFSLDAGAGRRLAGRVAVVLPPMLGVQKAGWVVRQGEAG